MSGYGPADEPSEAPTGFYDYGDAEPGEQGQTPPGQPWYRRPIISLTVGLFAAILLGLVIYLLADKTKGHGGTTQTPTSPTTPSVTPATPTTLEPTTTEPVAPPPTTSMTFTPTTTPPPAATTTTPPTTTFDDGRHHHHHHDENGTP